MEFEAELAYLPKMLEFILDGAQAHGLSKEALANLELASEEALVNIISYAYPTRGGKVKLSYATNSSFELLISDTGIPYNPLENAPPVDTEAPLDHRQVGGLGIFLIKKLIPKVRYERVGNENRLHFFL